MIPQENSSQQKFQTDYIRFLAGSVEMASFVDICAEDSNLTSVSEILDIVCMIN